MNQLSKAEILWSRTCPLSCSYCKMVDGRKNTGTLEQWKLGFDNLKKLGCTIAVFFGAEPLYDFNNLPEVIEYSEKIGIPTTVITSGIVPKVNEKLRTLYDHGLRSLSVSFDILDDINEGSRLKTGRAKGTLLYFKSLGPVRDLAAIATLTRTNFRMLPIMASDMSKDGIWTLFDPLHLDRSLPGTKCANDEHSDSLMFKEEDMEDLRGVFELLLKMKKSGYKIHASVPYLEKIIHGTRSFLGEYLWCCADYKEFPSWVTIDCDLKVNCCDDYHPVSPFLVTDLYENWEHFTQYWKRLVHKHCPGCAWNNYHECHLIKSGKVPSDHFIHVERKVG